MLKIAWLFLFNRPLAKVSLSWVQGCRLQRSGWSARQISFYDCGISRSGCEILSTYKKYAQSQSVFEPRPDCSAFLFPSEHGIWISWKAFGCFHEVLPTLDIRHLPECEGAQQTHNRRLWTIENRACFHNWKRWQRFERSFGRQLPALSGCDASFCHYNAVFDFFWTLNRLLTDIHQHHFKHGITGLECLLARQPKLAWTYQSVFYFPYRSTDGRLADAVGLSNMKLCPIFTLVHQGHQQLVGSTQFAWPAKVSQAFFNHFQHQFKGFALDASQSFEVTVF